MKKYLSTVLLIVGLATGFAGGYFFKNYQQQEQRNSFRNGTAGQRFTPGAGGGQRGMMFGSGVEGEILSMDDKSVTVKLNDGSSKIVLFSDTTNYSNLSVSKKADLKTGIKIAVFGKSNSDGSMTADRIQLNPLAIPSPAPSK